MRPTRREFPSFLALLATFVCLAFVAPSFYSPANLRDIALSAIPVLLIGCGMTFVIVVSEIDVSVGSIFAVTAVVCGHLAKAGLPDVFLIISATVVGFALGAVNGSLISLLRAPSIVITLATMVSLREALRWVTGGAWVQNLPPSFQWFHLGQLAGEAVITAAAVLIYAGFSWAAKNLSVFRYIYATGSDAEAARLMGVPVRAVVFFAFVLLGGLTGLAAILNAVRFSDVPANGGIDLELKAIAAVVVGGTPITGGRGSFLGTFFGVVLLSIIGPALVFLGISPYWERALQGFIILATVLIEASADKPARARVTRAFA